MASRGMFFGEGPSACPFIALESDRDRRAEEPDHRHRCYAEPEPAPRALAHQRAYCLSAAFPACAIFQDWAVRAAATPVPLPRGRMLGGERDPQPAWAAPPPWLAEGGAASPANGQSPSRNDDGPPADELDGEPATTAPGSREERASVPPFLAGRVGAGLPAPGHRAPGDDAPRHDVPDRLAPDRESVPPIERVPTGRLPRLASAPAGDRAADIVPGWQHRPLYPKYAGARSRWNPVALLGRIVRVLALGVTLALAIAGLIMVPALVAGPGTPDRMAPAGGSSPSAVPSPAPPTRPPTPTPKSSPRLYTVKAGDTVFAIARGFGLTVEQLLTANPEISDANLVQIGQLLVIPEDDFGLLTPASSPLHRTPRP